MGDPMMQVLVAKWLVICSLVFVGLVVQDIISDWSHKPGDIF